MLVALTAALVAVSAAHTRPPTPSAYLARALTLMRSNAVVTPKGGWTLVERRAKRMARAARTDAQTYGSLVYAIQALYAAGDVHARFANPLMAKLAAQTAKTAETAETQPPSVSMLSGGKVGVIALPAIASAPTSANARRYATAALSSIATDERSSAPCGWIVDLRGNTGGDMYPMLLAVGPILGNGPLIGFQSRSGFQGYVSADGGVLSTGAYRFASPLAVPALEPAPAVALLTDGSTLSSGEAVAVAFHGRPQVRTFGASTGGAPTSPQTYRLADGATLTFSTADDVDRDGLRYTGPIAPDQPTTDPDGPSTESAAASWLLTTPACSAAGAP